VTPLTFSNFALQLSSITSIAAGHKCVLTKQRRLSCRLIYSVEGQTIIPVDLDLLHYRERPSATPCLRSYVSWKVDIQYCGIRRKPRSSNRKCPKSQFILPITDAHDELGAVKVQAFCDWPGELPGNHDGIFTTSGSKYSQNNTSYLCCEIVLAIQTLQEIYPTLRSTVSRNMFQLIDNSSLRC
jgi:hypothetical protein